MQFFRRMRWNVVLWVMSCFLRASSPPDGDIRLRDTFLSYHSARTEVLSELFESTPTATAFRYIVSEFHSYVPLQLRSNVLLVARLAPLYRV